MTDMRAFLQGALAVFRGVAVLRENPLLIRFVLYPLVLTVIGYVALLVVAWWYFPGWIDDLVHWMGVWEWLKWVVEILAVIVFVVASVVTFVAVASLVAAPFNDPLSERIEQLVRGRTGDTPTGNWGIIRDVARSVLQEARRLLIYLGLLVGGLCLLLIPVAGGVLFPVLMIYVSIRYLA